MANPNIVNVSSILGVTLVTTLITTANTTILVNNDANTVYKINVISASNTLPTSTAVLNLQVNNGSADESLLSTVDIASDSTLIAVDKNSSFYLTEGYSIKGSSGTNTSIDLLISYEKIS